MKRKVVLLIINILIVGLLSAQDYQQRLRESRNRLDYGFSNIVDAKYHHGRFLKNSGSLNDIMDNPYDAIDIRVGFQANGKYQKYDQLYNFPVYGVGFYHVYFKGGELGNPQAL